MGRDGRVTWGGDRKEKKRGSRGKKTEEQLRGVGRTQEYHFASKLPNHCLPEVTFEYLIKGSMILGIGRGQRANSQRRLAVEEKKTPYYISLSKH